MCVRVFFLSLHIYSTQETTIEQMQQLVHAEGQSVCIQKCVPQSLHLTKLIKYSICFVDFEMTPIIKKITNVLICDGIVQHVL